MRKLSPGFTLIELIIFIVIVGIAATAILLSFQTVLSKSPDTNKQTIATELAEGRMDLIIGQYYIYGLSSFSDICNGSSPAVCMTISGYTVSSSITGTGPKTITVTVSGSGSAVLTAQVS